MKIRYFALCLMALSAAASFAYAEEALPEVVVPAAEAAAPVVAEAVAPVEAVLDTIPPAPPVEPAVVTPAVAPELLTDNLEFISGEVSVLDEASKSVSVRLYGEEGDAAEEKILKVVTDENTDITDGEQDRDLKSLTVGTEVDVEYDPVSNKATYIFVY